MPLKLKERTSSPLERFFLSREFGNQQAIAGVISTVHLCSKVIMSTEGKTGENQKEMRELDGILAVTAWVH